MQNLFRDLLLVMEDVRTVHNLLQLKSHTFSILSSQHLTGFDSICVVIRLKNQDL